MTTTARIVAGLVGTAVLLAGSVTLMRAGIYGWTLFVIAPILVGAIGSWVRQPDSGGRAALVGARTATGGLLLFLLLGFEGLVCVLMSVPLAAPLGALGGWAFYRVVNRTSQPGVLLPALLLAPLASIVYDVNAKPQLFEVRTSLEVAATPAQVWTHVVSFSDLPEPDDWFFRTGLAYPLRARITGSGVGAVRRCEFSTGAFIEPITTWEAASLLRFDVTENPAPMHEWSPYGQITPKHLHGFMVSERGQFRLTPLPGGKTLLEGTTWYRHGLWPAGYWRLWSDAVIHRIHLRVLRHIRRLAETELLSRSR